MSTCNECGAEVDDFEVCTHGANEGFFAGAVKRSGVFGSRQPIEDDFKSESDHLQTRANTVIFAPLSALILDVFVPTWSSWYVNLLFIALGSAAFIQMARIRKSGNSLNLKLFVLGMINSFNAPGQISKNSTEKTRNKNLLSWIAVVVLTFFALFAVGTPGNSIALENAIKGQIKSATGLSPTVKCPRTFIAIPGKDVTCKVDTILGITVPLNIQVNSPFEKLTWDLNPLR